MEHLKTFEGYSEEDEIVFRQLFDMNPNNKENDLFAFVAKFEFIEEDDGRFRKVLGIEKMIKITNDSIGMGNLEGLIMRGSHVSELNFYKIWLPKDISGMVENKGYEEIEDYILDAIGEKLKNRETRKQITDITKLRNDVKDQMDQMGKFNL